MHTLTSYENKKQNNLSIFLRVIKWLVQWLGDSFGASL